MTGTLANGPALRDLVRRELTGAYPGTDPDSVSFLAAGEYTLNYKASVGDREFVLRIVTGSQMGLDTPQQASYEAHALDLLAPTARVPELVGVQPSPDVLEYPYLLLEFLPGRPLDYATDLEKAARCVAEIHRLDAPADHRLQLHLDPVRSILDESRMLLGELSDDARRDAIRALFDRIASAPEDTFNAVRADQAIINTDLNSHNFIVDDEEIWLVDWEKARIAPTLMDIAHFLLPTTTLWRDATATRLSADQRNRFLDTYLAVRPELDGNEYRTALGSAMQLAALRALSWCAWSVAASERGERAIQNEETLSKCQQFTSAEFLGELTSELWS